MHIVNGYSHAKRHEQHHECTKSVIESPLREGRFEGVRGIPNGCFSDFCCQMVLYCHVTDIISKLTNLYTSQFECFRDRSSLNSFIKFRKPSGILRRNTLMSETGEQSDGSRYESLEMLKLAQPPSLSLTFPLFQVQHFHLFSSSLLFFTVRCFQVFRVFSRLVTIFWAGSERKFALFLAIIGLLGPTGDG